jgi:hypothetical protein
MVVEGVVPRSRANLGVLRAACAPAVRVLMLRTWPVRAFVVEASASAGLFNRRPTLNRSSDSLDDGSREKGNLNGESNCGFRAA